MAANTDTITVAGYPVGVSNTLDTTLADTITIVTTAPARVNVLNRATSNTIHVRPDGVTAVANADGTIPVPPGTSIEWAVGPGTTTVVSVVGSADLYNVTVTPQSAWV